MHPLRAARVLPAPGTRSKPSRSKAPSTSAPAIKRRGRSTITSCDKLGQHTVTYHTSGASCDGSSPILGACVLLIAALLLSATAASTRADALGIRQPSGEYRGSKVGARTEVRDVESDAEVQELGRFSVGEYNRQLRGGGGSRLQFGRVVAAQRQVVSGLKYYLRVAATEKGAENAAEREFDAVVVVKPWLEKRTLLTFAPAAAK